MVVHAQVLAAQATDRTLLGRITVVGTGQPVDGAEVSIEGTVLVTRTDSLGRWVLRDVPLGSQVVLVRRIGFAPARTPVVVPTSGTLTVDVVLAANPLGLEQIIVTAEGTRRARDELGTASVIERDAIANQISSSLQGVLELLPGVPPRPVVPGPRTDSWRGNRK
jgi:outer membrane receptor for ferrienterochelin and colicins